MRYNWDIGGGGSGMENQDDSLARGYAWRWGVGKRGGVTWMRELK